jgi:hypothetical protein
MPQIIEQTETRLVIRRDVWGVRLLTLFVLLAAVLISAQAQSVHLDRDPGADLRLAISLL